MPPFIDAVIDWVRARPPVSWVWPASVYLPQPPMGGIYREPVETWLPPIPTNGNGGDATEHRDTRRPETTPRRLKDKPVAGASIGKPAEFYFKESILDQLDHYFYCLRRMREADRDAYQLYRQVGAHVLPRKVFPEADDMALSPWWLQHRPGFGAIAYAIDPFHRKREIEKKMMYPRFVYFMKFKREKAPPALQRVPEGDVYVMTVYWDRPDKMKIGAPTSFGVMVKEDGSLQLMMMLQREAVRVRVKQRVNDAFEAHPHVYIPQTRWGIDDFFVDWARYHKTDPTQYLLGIFCEACNTYDMAQQGLIRIDAAKGEMHAVFSVNVKRTPYFFKDRDVMVNERGARRRIFHIVREHDRVIAIERDGAIEEKTITVKSHYRGQRDFLWNGYRMHITVPGLHHVKVGEFDLSAIDVPFEERKSGVPVENVGRMLRELIAGREPAPMPKWPDENDDDDVRGDAGGSRDAAA